MAQVQRLELRGVRALVSADRRTDCGPSGAAVYRELTLVATTALPFGGGGSGGDAGGGAGGAGAGAAAGAGAGAGGNGVAESGPEGPGSVVTEAGEVLGAGPTSGGEGKLRSGTAAPWLGGATGSDDFGAALVLLVSLAAGGLWLALTSPLWRRS